MRQRHRGSARPPAWCAAWLIVAACGTGESTPGAVRTDSAGVEIVVSTGGDRPAPFVLELEWTVGGAEGPDLTEIRPWQVTADESGRVHILDDVAKRIYVVDGAGVVVDTLGRPGKGPGELSSPVSLDIAADGTVGVWDYGHGGLVRWRGGEPVPLQRANASFWGPDIRVLGGATAFVTLSADGPPRQRLVIADTVSARALAELNRPPDRPAEFPTCGIRGIPVPPLFAPELNWDVHGDRVIASSSAAYEIRVMSLTGPERDGESAGLPGGDAVRAIWRRAVPQRPVTEQLALQEVGEGLPIPVTGCTVPAGEVVRSRGYAEVVPAVRRLVVDRSGRVWVLRGGLTDEPHVVDIFDATGVYSGTLSAGAPAPAAFPAQDRVVGLITTEPGVRVLGSWRIRAR